VKVLCVFAKFDYGDPARGHGYEYCNFIPALTRLGHVVTFFDSKDRSTFSDFAELNHALIEVVMATRPDVILSVQMLYEVWSETWRLIRERTPAVLLNWTTDDSWRYESFSRFVAPSFHAVTTTYAEALVKYRRDGFNHVLLTQWAANAEALAEPLQAAQCEHDVTFIGSAHGNRREVIRSLSRRGITVRCFGHGWDAGAIAAEDIPRVIRSSRISLNLANSAWLWRRGLPHRHRQIKARVFEVPGAGGFLLTESAPGLAEVFEPGREVAVFRTLDELAWQIRHYLDHPEERDAIARAGHARTRREHTCDRRMAEFLDFGVRQAGSPAVGSDSDGWQGEFQKVMAQHRTSRAERAFRTGLGSLCTHVWGGRRGLRAARRITFELSWRLAGARTYSATGWPGKLFFPVS
jgi:spore maturation protein CgeB